MLCLERCGSLANRIAHLKRGSPALLSESSASRMEIWPSRVTDSEQQQLSPKELQTFRGSLCTLPTRRTRLMGISSLWS